MDIPITIKIEQSKEAELDRDLFGVGEEITDPETVKWAGKGAYRINTSRDIVEGVTVSHRQFPREIRKAMESAAPIFIDAHFIISIVDLALGLVMNTFTVAEWFLNRTKSQSCRIIIDGEEVKTTPEFQQKLKEYIKNHSDQ